MFYISILLIFISGLILISKDTYFIALFLSIISFYLFYKKVDFTKKRLILYIVALILPILISLTKYIEFNPKTIIGVVVDKGNNYIVVRTFFKKYYIYSSDQITLYSILKINGNIAEYKFKTLESAFDFNKYLENKGIFHQFYIKNYSYIFKNPLNLNSIKKAYLAKYETDNQDFVNSLLFNSTNYNSSYIYKARSLNMINLISLTGIYLNFILYGIYNIIKKFFNTKLAYIVSLILFIPICIINSDSFLVFRIFTLFLIKFILELKNIKYDEIKIKTVFILILLITDHYLIYSYSFIIFIFIFVSFTFLKLLLSRYKGIKKKIFTYFIIFILFFPFQIQFNNSFNIISSLISFILLPITKVLFLMILLGFYGLYFNFYNKIINFFIKILFNLNIDKLNINVAPLNQYFIVIYYVLVFIIFYFMESNNKIKISIYSSVLITSIILYSIPLKNYFLSNVTFLNVDQGDATYINYKNTSILIDTGGLTYQDVAKNSLIPFLKKNRVYSIDYIFISHYDFDHYGALDSLKNNFTVKNIYDYNSTYPVQINDLCFENLNIYSNLWEEENDKSTVLKLKIKDKIFIFCGDATKKIEKVIVDFAIDLKCDYLKVGHHGSNTSSLDEFIKKCSPKEAIISCGYNNKFKHPHSDTLKTLNKYKIKIRRTDIEGSIIYKF